jgi:hypothetical protein
MQDFPSNSQRSREPEPEIKQVTSAETGRRKRGLGRQFKDAFIVGTGRDAMGYVVEDVVVPAIRDTLSEALQGGIERLIYGPREGRAHRPRSSSLFSGPNMGHVNYSGLSTSASKQPPPRTLSRRARARHSFDELVIPSLQEANDVIDRMYDILARYGQVTVANLYSLTGIESSHTDMKWGWTNLRGTRAVRLRQGGFLLDLPTPEELR